MEAEKSVLGSILLVPKVIEEVASIMEPDDFYSEANRCIYRHLLAMSAAGDRIDTTLLVDRLRRTADYERAGGVAYLAEVVQSVAVASHAVYYAKIVVRTSRKRQVIHAIADILPRAYDDSIESDDLLMAAETAFAKIKSGAYDRDPVSMEAAMIDALVEIEEISEGKRVLGIKTGIQSFDEQVGGVFCQELTLLAARTSQGKTSLALEIAANMANDGEKVYFATLEMSRKELAMKRAASLSGVSFKQIRTGKVTPEDKRKIAMAVSGENGRNLQIHDWPEIRPWDIHRAAKRMGATAVFVDYLQIVKPPPGDDRGRKRYEAIGQIAKALKVMARDLDVPVVACAQLGRKAEEGKEERPRLRHLRESGDLEQDCDMALLLWRPEGGIEGAKNSPYAGDKWDAELAVAKQRNGDTPTIRLDWDGKRTLFLDHARDLPEAF